MGGAQGRMASPAVTSKLGAELGWLQRTQRRLRAAISDAEQEQIIEDEDFARWLQEMKDIACDAEDLIDEFEYEELRPQIGGSGWSARRRSLSGKVILPKITVVRQRMEALLMEKNGPRFENPVGSLYDKEVTQGEGMLLVSLSKNGEVFGREKEEEEIIEFLVASDDEVTLSTIAITGMGGLGKTTLAQLVYNEGRVETHFTVKMWVCVTDVDDDDVLEVTRLILGATGFYMKSMRGVKNLGLYQRRLVDKLKGRRFLLVLDNLRDPDWRKWQTIYAPLIYGEKGSKVLVTTRDQHVARNLLATKMVQLGGLHFDDCWKLFKTHAFTHGNCEEHPRLEAIGKQIVEKFEGVPLAAVVMGGHLGSRLEEDEWIRILERDHVWEKHAEEEDGILSVLKLSYDYLPPHLKQCFAYCSLFPKSRKFDRLELVHLWMAQGFVETRRMKRMEDVGTEYFNDLFHRSFFQYSADGKFAIHDLMHDLAQLVSHCDHSIRDINGGGSHEISLLNNKDAHNKLRHLSVLVNRCQPSQSSLEALCMYRNLRTLAFYYSRKIKFQIPHELLLSFSRLRFLDLSCGGLEILPDSIGTLMHLRYLDLRENNFRKLPKSLCHLYFLQTLKLKACYFLNELPRGISNLIHLRHLEAEDRALSKVVGFGKLTRLQELASLPISQGKGIKIEDLKNMNDLRGKISISNLSRVRSKEEAMRAMLSSKRYLRKLEMTWDIVEGGSFEHEEEILEALAPPPDLKELSIKFYGGPNFPSWMEQPSFTKLESLCLRECRNLDSLPQLWRLPFLITIELVCCPQLKNLPPISITLRELTIDGTGLEELPEFYQPPPASDDRESCFNTTTAAPPSLSVLRVSRCHALRSLQRGLLRCHYLRHLTVLSIQRCRNLSEWPEGDEFRATLLSLQKELCLDGCPKLRAFPAGSTLSASLETVSIMGCPNIVDGPLLARLQDLPSESIVCVKKGYANLQHCFEEALRHIRTVNWLVIEENQDDEEWEQNHHLSLVCNREQLWSWRCHKRIVAWIVRIRVYKGREMRNALSLIGGAALPQRYFVSPDEWWGALPPPEMPISTAKSSNDHPDDQYSPISSSCSGEEEPNAVVLDVGASSLNLFNMQTSSVEILCISHCRGTRPLLAGALLTDHLTSLKELHVFDCPNLTFSSLQELIPSLTSLRRMSIKSCPRLMSSPSPSCLPGKPSLLQTLFVDDDDTLLGDAGFVRLYLMGSLRGLHIWHVLRCFSSLTVEAEEGLRRLGQSLCHLSFKSCPYLEQLPSDLRGLLPSLKALSIGDCPKLRHLPAGGLPACLEILVIHGCRLLEGRCTPPPPPAGEEEQQRQQQQTDWHKIAHVRVIVNQGELVQGSYREFLELRAKWRDF